MSATFTPVTTVSAGALPTARGLYDAAALREVETRAIAALGGDGFELMRRAGRAGWRCLLRHWPQAHRIVVVCGPGNNGGDGYVLARHALQAGRDVQLVHAAGHEPRSELARQASDDCLACGVRSVVFNGGLPPADLVVDAMFGIGFARVPDAPAAALIDAINAHRAPGFALDVPSGVHADRGSVPGAAVRATRTLEFIAAKAGLRTGAALDHTGTLDLATLDIPTDAFTGIAPRANLLQPDDLRQWLGPRPRDTHKGRSGRLLCIGGDHGQGGAIVLCAHAGLRSGAGLVQVATRQAHADALLARIPEVMVQAVEHAHDIDSALLQADGIALGPGLGQGVWGHVLFEAALSVDKPLLLDADALNLLAKQPRSLPAATILTPHPGEAARLLDMQVADVQADRLSAAQALSERFACVVVLKGAGTLVAAPGQVMRLVAAGNPGMAVAGMGDLLAGTIAALHVQGLNAFDAATAGALLHAVAGDAAANEGGERGLMPSDLLPHLRRLSNPVARR